MTMTNPLGAIPKRVEVYEVGPRDGLQNELRTLATADKARLIEALVGSGLKRIEVSSFVSPRWIPQLADAEKLIGLVPRREGVVFTALVPNLKGLERARAAGLQEAAVFLSVTESHSQKNINKSVADAISTAREVANGARAAGMRVRCYLSTVWGCPYEGITPVARVVEVVKQLADIGFYQLSLGDTIGVGTPSQTAEIVGEVSKVVGLGQIALHLHDTRGTALANALVGLSMGVTTFDASIGGLGGCPYAPGAAGNLATEDLVFMLQGMGVETGIDLGKLVEAGELAQELIGRKLSGKYLQAALGEREKMANRARK
ncbi:MAG: hydroxymethylglutaryl-CoA lyase [Archangium sp.]|nr:hydroxymethylglutaryl-CoA lyase [Archangium sp.]